MLKLEVKEARNNLIRDIPLGWKQKLSFSVAIIHNPKIAALATHEKLKRQHNAASMNDVSLQLARIIPA